MKGDGRPLRAYWSKREHDLMIDYPTSPDGWFLHGILSKEFTEELKSRGYDITTLRFSIKQKSDGKGI